MLFNYKQSFESSTIKNPEW